MTPDHDRVVAFRRKLLYWFNLNHRIFPWRNTRDPYRVLVAEMLLQKTNAAKVVPVYRQMIKEFPDVRSLAEGRVPKIRLLIKPLGLVYRARRLKILANEVVSRHRGRFPRTGGELRRLHGVGDYMTNALLAFAFDEPVAIVDTNVVRVLGRVFGIQSRSARARTDKELWNQVGLIVPRKGARRYNLAILDFAALVCTAHSPRCPACTMKQICLFYGRSQAERSVPPNNKP